MSQPVNVSVDTILTIPFSTGLRLLYVLAISQSTAVKKEERNIIVNWGGGGKKKTILLISSISSRGNPTAYRLHTIRPTSTRYRPSRGRGKAFSSPLQLEATDVIHTGWQTMSASDKSSRLGDSSG